jgi:hypothetical protein
MGFTNSSKTSTLLKISYPGNPRSSGFDPKTVLFSQNLGYIPRINFRAQTGSTLRKNFDFLDFPNQSNFCLPQKCNSSRHKVISNLTKDEASFFSLSTTSSVALFTDDALDLPKEAPCESRDFLSKTKTEVAFPVDFFFASYIFHGPEVEDGEAATV